MPLLEAVPIYARSARRRATWSYCSRPTARAWTSSFAHVRWQRAAWSHHSAARAVCDHLLLLDGLTTGVTAIAPDNEHQRGMAAWLTGQPNATGDSCGATLVFPGARAGPRCKAVRFDALQLTLGHTTVSAVQ